ncbi:MAG TPA: heavy metal-binding domain-containing protein [Pyrinomonadaceae bacterium]
MTKRIYRALATLAAAVALSTVGASDASARCDGLHQHGPQHAGKKTHQRVRSARHRAWTRRRTGRQAVAYVCPMHPDIRERSRGTCPKCLMELVAEPRGVKTGGAGAAASGGM